MARWEGPATRDGSERVLADVEPVDPAAQGGPPDQVPFGATCQMCQSAWSAPRAKTSSRPSLFWLDVQQVDPAAQGGPAAPAVPFGATCQMCHRRLVRTAGEHLEPAVGVLADVEQVDPAAAGTAQPRPGAVRARPATCARARRRNRGRRPRAGRRRCGRRPAGRSSRPATPSRDQPLFGRGLPDVPDGAWSEPRAKTSMRPSAFWPTARWVDPAAERLPSRDQPLFGATCQVCQTRLSEPRAKTSSRPSALRADARAWSTQPPSDVPARPAAVRRDLPLVPDAPSEPRAKTSSRPSALRPHVEHVDPAAQGLPAATSRCSARSATCARAPGRAPRAKISSRPVAPTRGLPDRGLGVEEGADGPCPGPGERPAARGR